LALCRRPHSRPAVFRQSGFAAASEDPTPLMPLHRSSRVMSLRSATPETYFGTGASSLTLPSSAMPYSTSQVIMRVTSATRKDMSVVTLVSSPAPCVPSALTHSPLHGTHTPTMAPDEPVAVMAF